MSEPPRNKETDTTNRAGRNSDGNRGGDRRRRRRDDTIQWISGAAALLGLWIAVSPFLYETVQSVLWNNVVVGAAIFLVSGYNFYRVMNGDGTSVSVMSLVALLGLWAVVAPLVLEVESQALLWSNVVAGIIVALLAGYVAYSVSAVRTGAPAGTR